MYKIQNRNLKRNNLVLLYKHAMLPVPVLLLSLLLLLTDIKFIIGDLTAFASCGFSFCKFWIATFVFESKFQKLPFGEYRNRMILEPLHFYSRVSK